MINSKLYDDQFNTWILNEKLAVNLLNYSGQLMYDKGIEIVLFRQNILDIGVTELMRLFSYAENVVKRKIDIKTALELIKEINHLTLPPSKLDIGLLTAEYIEDSANSFKDFLEEKLSKICDAILSYNRDIYNRTDDSVVMEVNELPRITRRSRGFAPSPIQLYHNVDGILATGAEMKNCFCIGKSRQALMSQHIGELNNIETFSFYKETIERFKNLFKFRSIIHNDSFRSRISAQPCVIKNSGCVCRVIGIFHFYYFKPTCGWIYYYFTR